MVGQLDYKMYFRKTESGFNVDQFANFEVPMKFHERVSKVIEKFRQEDRVVNNKFQQMAAENGVRPNF
jgi:hypothetical protein